MIVATHFHRYQVFLTYIEEVQIIHFVTLTLTSFPTQENDILFDETSVLIFAEGISECSAITQGCLTVTTHTLRVAPLPGGSVGTTDGVVGAVTLHTQTTVFATSRCKASSLAVLVHGVYDPVDAGVVSDRDVLGIDKDDFIIFVCGVLVDPVRVKNSEIIAVSASSLLSNTSQVSDEFQLVNTLILWLAVHNALVVGPLAAPTTDSATIDDITLQ